MRNWRILRGVLILAAALPLWGCSPGGPELETREITEYNPPPADENWLRDDDLATKQPKFDPNLVDRRQLEGWLVNASGAVIRLDVPMILPDAEGHLVQLTPSYAHAWAIAKNNPSYGVSFLPSVNLIDGKAKQFDDGLYAAIDLAYFEGVEGQLRGHVQLIEDLLAQVPADSQAAAYLAAGLSLADREVSTGDPAARQTWLARFRSHPLAAKPIGFYTWNEKLKKCWAFTRFFQMKLVAEDLNVVQTLTAALRSNEDLLADYRRSMQLFANLTNPYSCFSLDDVLELTDLDQARLDALVKEQRRDDAAVAFFPSSTSREKVLFEKLFPLGIPPDANLMRELVERIRSGQVDLTPTETSGWYEHQVYALETLLLPEKGPEGEKLLLTKAYKKRMLEAFKALITKRRETHSRQLDTAEAAAAPPPAEVAPRLRVEPNPSYYLRTARSYSFLTDVLTTAVGAEILANLHGLRSDAPRELDLNAELAYMRNLFYGLHLISAEDIGMAPALAEGELAEPDRCYELAEKWLSDAANDPDLAADTRVSIPIMTDPGRNVTRLWVTVGVRLTKLEAEYARPPSIRPTSGEGDWTEVDRHELAASHYLIAVDEFAEIELPGLRSFDREELRAICDQAKTKEAILEALRGAN